MEYRPIAAWLKKNRLAQLDPATRRPWTQKHLVEVFRAETGWPMYASNYSKYESGVSTPEPTTLDRFIAFWAKFGIEGPDLTPPPEPTEATESGVALGSAIKSQTDAITALLAEIQAERTERTTERAEWRRLEEERRQRDEEYRAAMESRFAFLESVVRSLRDPSTNRGTPKRPVLAESVR